MFVCFKLSFNSLVRCTSPLVNSNHRKVLVQIRVEDEVSVNFSLTCGLPFCYTSINDLLTLLVAELNRHDIITADCWPHSFLWVKRNLLTHVLKLLCQWPLYDLTIFGCGLEMHNKCLVSGCKAVWSRFVLHFACITLLQSSTKFASGVSLACHIQPFKSTWGTDMR